MKQLEEIFKGYCMGLLKGWSLLSGMGKGAIIVILMMVLLAIFAPLLTSLPPNVSSGPPLVPPGGKHLLGTDELGVDLWAMICHGARVSIAVGVGTALLAGLGGGLVGMLAALKGGWVDRVVMRVVDVMVALPSLPVMIVLAAFFGSSVTNIILVLAIVSWAMPARIVRSQGLVLKEQPYIKMASFYGASTWYMLRKHFLPELLPILAVSMIRLTSMAIIAEASLAFIGLGDPTSRSWGLIINHAINFRGIFFTDFWKWWLVYPWLMLTLLVTAFALLGRELERLAEPRVGK